MKAVPLALLAAIGLGISTQPFSCLPRMHEVPSFRPYERSMPDMPAGVEQFGAPAAPGSREDAARLANPVRPSVHSRELGRIYYRYYCVMCHGDDGRGNGKVGVSYVPKPADLTGVRVQAMLDGELAFAMVMGSGHAPVLDRTVPWHRRWYIVGFIRSLARRRPSLAASAEQGEDQVADERDRGIAHQQSQE